MKLAHINTNLIGRFMFCMSIGKVPESLTSLFNKTVIITHIVLELPIFIISLCEIRPEQNKNKIQGVLLYGILLL